MTTGTSSGRVDFHLYLITDRHQACGRGLCAVVEEALAGGVKAVQLREKDLSSRDLYELAVQLRQLTARYGACFFINDRLDIALATTADGVHLGTQSMPVREARRLFGRDKLLGVSCHDEESARRAEADGADFITFGPIYPTPSKARYGEPVGITRLEAVTKLLKIPIFALGGISDSTIREVRATGAFGIALISAVIAAPEPRQAATRLLASLATWSGQ